METRPPVTFQGGKQRLAPAIVDVLELRPDEPFYDLCCGSGAVTIEVVSRGHPTSLVGMVDDGPWGLVWEEVGAGRFSLDALRRVAAAVPERVEQQADFLRELRKQPVHVDTSAVFLILQAGSFGGMAVYFDGERWSSAGKRGDIRTAWRSKDDPTKHTATLMPCAAKVVRRMEVLCELLLGVGLDRGDFYELADLDGVVYVDPPYAGTAGYGGRATPAYDFAAFAARNPKASTWVSEARPLQGDAKRMAKANRQGGIRGKRAAPIEEWLTHVALDAAPRSA